MLKRCLIALLAVLAPVLMAGCIIGQSTGATNVGNISATLNGEVANVNTGAIEYWFRYGTTTAYGTETPHRRLTVSDGDFHAVSEPVTGLAPGTTYHFQVCERGGACGKDESFTTKAEKDLCGHISRDTTLSADAAVAYVLTCPVTVDPGVTLTLAPGTVVKSGGPEISVEGGSLVAGGVAGSPVVFTSLRDGSVGGATQEDGDPQPGDWGGIEVGDAVDAHGVSTGVGGRVELRHTRIAYARSGVATLEGGSGGPPVGASSVVLDHVSIGLGWRGVLLARVRSVRVSDSSFDHNQGAVGLRAGSVSVTGSSFAATGTSGYNDGALRVASFEDSPRVQNNVFTGTGAAVDPGSLCSDSFCNSTVAVESPRLDLSLLSGNSGGGNAAASFGLAGTLIASGSLGSLPSGWTPIIEAPSDPWGLRVPSGVTLTVPAGTVVKSVLGGSGTTISVEGGSLVAGGVAGSPVVFTSLRDGSVGGATQEDGDPQPGDWGGIRLDMPDATLDGTAVEVRFSGSAITLKNGTSRLSGLVLTDNQRGLVVEKGNVALRGRVDVPAKGISACDWGLECFVDASNVEWPTAAGPFPASGDLVCGSVSVSPWTSETTPFRVANCGGSPTPDSVLADAIVEWNDAIADACANGVCEVIELYKDCLGAAVGVAAGSSPFPLPGDSATDQADTWAHAYVDTFGDYLQAAAPPGGWATAASLASVGGKVVGVATTILSLASAYRDCVDLHS